jgi:hypothetical protein
MEWLPAASAAVLSAANPPLNVAVPMTVAPSRNCTLPVADAGAIVAVKVTDWPATDGFRDVAITADEAAFATLTVVAADELPALLVSPLYSAVIECVPAVRFVAVTEAEPPVRVTVASTVAPSRNCTVPVAEAGATVAVSCTLCPEVMLPLLADRAVEVGSFDTVCDRTPEVAPLSLLSPA